MKSSRFICLLLSGNYTLHILFLTPAYPPFPGGGERYVRALALELARRGHAVTAVTSAAATEQDFWQGAVQPVIRETQDGIQLVRCPLRPFPGGRPALMAWRKAMVLLSLLPGPQTAVLPRMARLIPPLQYLPDTLAQLPAGFDLVHGFNISWEYTLLAGRQFARQRGLPFIATPFAHLGTGADRVARNSTMKHQLRLLREADRVLTLTAIEKEELAQRSVLANRLDVIGTGLDPLPALPPHTTVMQNFRLSSPYVIFVGRASHDKGALHAAQAVLALRAQGTAVTLVLVGQSSPEFERFYRRLDAPEREGIRPLGILSDVDKHALIKNAAALLLPSRTDSFGIVLLEAWAHGLPVIAARAGGIPGVVDDGRNGILVEFGDVPALSRAIHVILTDGAFSQKIGRQGQEKVHAVYSWRHVGDRVLNNYEAVFKEQGVSAFHSSGIF